MAQKDDTFLLTALIAGAESGRGVAADEGQAGVYLLREIYVKNG